MIKLDYPKIEQVGNGFLKRIKSLKYLNMANLQKVGCDFLYYNSSLKELELPEDLATKVKNGNIINLSEEAEYMLFTSNDEDIALYKKNKNNYECLILF